MNGVNTQVEKAMLQAVVDFKMPLESSSQLKKVFMKGNKSIRDKCSEADLNLASVDELIKRHLGSRSSSREASCKGRSYC